LIIYNIIARHKLPWNGSFYVIFNALSGVRKGWTLRSGTRSNYGQRGGNVVKIRTLLFLAVILCIAGFSTDNVFAIGESQHVQIQLCFFSGGGVVLNNELTGIVEAYGEMARDQLNFEEYAMHGSRSFSTKEDNANFCYGVNFEPRLFISIFGVGVNFLFHWTNQARSEVTSYYDNSSVTYTAQLYGAAVVPTIYLRPIYESNYYFIIGVGRATYKTAVTIDTEDNVYNYSEGYSDPPFISEEMTGEATGYHFVIEFGLTMNNILFSCGVTYRYLQVTKFETPDGSTFINPATGEEMTAGLTGVYSYVGVGFYI